jgi:hypothetical protein
MVETVSKDYLYRISRYDGILIGLILILSTSWILDFLKQTAGLNGTAFVYENGRAIEKIDVKKDNSIELSLEKGEMGLEVKEGRIRVSNSSCPHKTCQNSGWISKPRRTIICVPNKVLIEIKGTPDPGYHALAY